MKNFKKIIGISLAFVAVCEGGASLYSPGANPSGKYQNANLNALGSQYAATYGHGSTSLMGRELQQLIFDAAPQQYFDLKILALTPPEQVNSDEHFYHEMGYGRDAITLGTLGTIGAAVTQTIPVVSTDVVTPDTIIAHFDDVTKATVIDVDSGASTITIKAMSGQILPALSVADSGKYFSNVSPVEADGLDYISQYYRIDTIERSNYVQMLVKAQRWGKMELTKYQRAGSLNSYLTMQKRRMMDQFRADLSNIYWNGEQGEVTLKSGVVAKTAGGLYPIMQSAGSPFSNTTVVNSPAALEELALSTEFEQYGATRFLYGTPRALLALSNQYKRPLTRYTPDNMLANLRLNSIDIGSSKIVFVPIKRFEDPASFPKAWRSRLFLIDQKNIQPVYFLPEEMGDTLPRVNNGTLKNYTDSWVSATWSMRFHNPLACGYLNVTNLG